MSIFIQAILKIINHQNAINESELTQALISSISSDTLNVSQQAQLLNMLSEQIQQSGIKRAAMSRPVIWNELDESSLDKLLA